MLRVYSGNIFLHPFRFFLFDKHDRVNYAVTDAKLRIDKEEKKIVLDLTIDTKMCRY